VVEVAVGVLVEEVVGAIGVCAWEGISVVSVAVVGKVVGTDVLGAWKGLMLSSCSWSGRWRSCGAAEVGGLVIGAAVFGAIVGVPVAVVVILSGIKVIVLWYCLSCHLDKCTGGAPDHTTGILHRLEGHSWIILWKPWRSRPVSWWMTAKKVTRNISWPMWCEHLTTMKMIVVPILD
jgi:hypothetical protein